MPRSIQVGVPRGWFWVMWLMAATVDPGTDRTGRAEIDGAARYGRSCRSVDVLSLSRPARSPAASSVGRCWPIWYRSTRCTPCCSRTQACPMRRSRRCSPCGPRSGSSPRSPPGPRDPLRPPHRARRRRLVQALGLRPGSWSPSFPASQRASCCGDWAAPSPRVRRRRCCTTGWSQPVPRSTTPGSRAGSARQGWSCRCRRPGSRPRCSSSVVIPRPGGRAS